MQAAGGDVDMEDVVDAYKCPICLQLLQAPVKLTCEHAFCWGCITMYCLGVLQSSSEDPADEPTQVDSDDSTPVATAPMAQLTQGWAPASERRVPQFACPVCQRKQKLDLDNLSVDRTLVALVDRHRSRSLQDVPGARSMDLESGAQLSHGSDTPLTPHSAASPSEVDSEAAFAMPEAQMPTIEEPQAILDKPKSLSVSSRTSHDSSTDVLPPAPSPVPALLPPRSAQQPGKMSIVLDIDGTLIASFPPRRAPQLPSHMKTHLVGAGSTLNPQGVQLQLIFFVAHFVKHCCAAQCHSCAACSSSHS